MILYALFLREGKYDGTSKGEDLYWGVYSSLEKARQEILKQWIDYPKSLGKESKMWIIWPSSLDHEDSDDVAKHFSLDGFELEDPPTGPKFVPPPEPPPGRCLYVYFCGMQGPSDIDLDMNRCIKEGYHREHKAKNDISFDGNCHELITNFPYVWTYYHSKDPKKKEAALAELVKLDPKFAPQEHT